jgi:hypothetical protein
MPPGYARANRQTPLRLKRPLLPSTAFIRSGRPFARKQPQAAVAFHPQLKTHKLKGKLAGPWASSAGYDLRVVFQFVQHKGAEAILLESLGTHDEVY